MNGADATGIGDLATGELAAAVVTRLRDLLVPFIGSPVELHLLKHKPGRRRTLRASGPVGSVIVKLFATDRAALVAARLTPLGSGPDEPLVPRPLLVDTTLRLLVLSDVPGTSLGSMLRDGEATTAIATAARVGTVIGGWHGAWAGRSPTPLTSHTVGREIGMLSRRAQGASPSTRRAVRDAAAGLRGPWTAATVVHRDLYEEQIIVGEHVGLIDLDDVALGPPELDVGNLLAHLELLELRSGLDLRDAAAALLDAYRSANALDPDLLDRCRRLSLLRLACIHDRPELIELAVRKAIHA